ncbi:MAG: TetR/AcrR family transcriptional regulator [Solirubrobacterales bacterium]
MPETPIADTDRRAATEQRIVDAADALLQEGHGFASLKIEEIAARAGIGRTAFYFYFRDKRELLLRLADSAGAELYELAEQWWGEEGDGAAQLRAQAGLVVRSFLDHGVLLRAVVDTTATDEVVREWWRALADRFIEATAQRIRREQAAGAPSAPAEETAAALVWMTERTCHQHLLRDPGLAGNEKLAEALAQIWTRAIYGVDA